MHVFYYVRYTWHVSTSVNFNVNTTLSIKLIKTIVWALDNGDSVIRVFLDFSNAFDTVDHTILSKKTTFIKFGIKDLA